MNKLTHDGSLIPYEGTATDTVRDIQFPNNGGAISMIISNDDATNEFYVKPSRTQASSGIVNSMAAAPETNGLMTIKKGEVVTLTECLYRQVSIICASGETSLYRIWVQIIQ